MIYFRCEFILQEKGFDFVKNIVSRFPNLKRPSLRHSPFGQIAMQLIPAAGCSKQKQPLVMNSKRTSAKAASESVSVKKIAAPSSAFKQQAIDMGFSESAVERVVCR